MALPPELWYIILHMADRRTRIASRAVCRLFASLAQHPSDVYRIPPDASLQQTIAVLQSHSRVWLTSTGRPDQWTGMAGSTSLREVRWEFSYTPPRAELLRFSAVLSATYQCLPMYLTHLSIDTRVGLSDFLIRSLCFSLLSARSIQAVSLRGVGSADTLNIVNALSQRARNPYNMPLQELMVLIDAPHDSSAPPDVLDVSGLVSLHTIDIQCPLTNTLPALIAIRKLVDEILVRAETSLQRFVYTGIPLVQAEAWAHLIHRSVTTLSYLLVPQFENTEFYPTPIEMAVDEVQSLRTLVVNYPTARLDFMLKNKPHLEVVVHNGSVYDEAALFAQLVPLVAITQFYIAANLSVGFLSQLACSVRWPNCQALSFAGVESHTCSWLLQELRRAS